MLNQIETFEFVNLRGNPETAKQQIAHLTRDGVDNATFIDNGLRGVPFTIRSQVDLPDLATARQVYVAYCELIGGDPVDITWQDIDLSAEGYSFAVLDVTLAGIKPLVVASGGLNAGLAWLECDWTLVAIATAEETEEETEEEETEEE